MDLFLLLFNPLQTITPSDVAGTIIWGVVVLYVVLAILLNPAFLALLGFFGICFAIAYWKITLLILGSVFVLIAIISFLLDRIIDNGATITAHNPSIDPHRETRSIHTKPTGIEGLLQNIKTQGKAP